MHVKFIARITQGDISMKSKILPSLIALGFSTLAIGAQAQQAAGLEIYGLVGASYTKKNNQGATNASVTELSTNAMNVSHIGFRGREDLGGGMSAVFRLESTLAPDNGTIGKPIAYFDRQAFVGVASTQWGAITLGRQFHASTDRAIRTMDVYNLAPANAHLVPVALYGVNRYASNDNRVSNSIKYRLDAPKGFQFGASIGMGEVAGSTTKGASSSYDLAYVGPNYQVGIGWVGFNGVNAQGTTTTLPKHEVTSIGGSMNFGSLTPYLSHYSSSLDSATTAGLKAQTNSINTAGLAWKVSNQILVRGAYTTDKGTDLNNVAGRNGTKKTTVVSAEYALSKRTSVNIIRGSNSLSGGYLLEPLYTAALGRNPAATSVQFWGAGVNHQF
jgi:predicted porin